MIRKCADPYQGFPKGSQGVGLPLQAVLWGWDEKSPALLENLPPGEILAGYQDSGRVWKILQGGRPGCPAGCHRVLRQDARVAARMLPRVSEICHPEIPKGTL